ncbi:MAG TPA: hypothetical protein VF809_03245 [Candidatus Saccharimonadales bacterium]
MSKPDNSSVLLSELVERIDERVNGAVADANSFVFMRLNGHLGPGLGGGNIASATVLFNVLNLLAKVNLFIDNPGKFTEEQDADVAGQLRNEILEFYEGDVGAKKRIKKHFQMPRIDSVDESYAFKHFVRYLHGEGIDLGIPHDNSEAIGKVWNGFRNKLSHVSTVEYGKSVIVFDVGHKGDVESFMDRVANEARRSAFVPGGNSSGWRLYVDVLLQTMLQISETVINKLKTLNKNQVDLLRLSKIIC